MRILIAMSGGVDSSVLAHLLKEQGHDLVGVMMKLWTDPLAPEVQRAIPTKCCSVEHIQRARSVCDTLGIPFYVLNLEEEFKEQVVDPFLQSHTEGETPNPCIACNKTVKFGALLQKVQELGCDKLATGHYARIATETQSDGKSKHVLLEAEDSAKDQSYYLYTLTQEKLSKILFPLGNMKKEEVFALAQKYNVPLTEQYRESQDLCFFPEKDPSDFLRRYLPEIESGDIRTEDETKVGTHKGLPFYTVGQRKGLGIGGLQIPLHVSRKDTASNTLYVAENGEDMSKTLHAVQMHWISWSPNESQEVDFLARVSSLGEKRKGTLTYKGENGEFTFNEPVRGIAPGQSIVLYRGAEVVGGGRISS
jgi:tRNA-specific 2-thiouridylase